MKRLGVIGGMGAAASSLFYEKIISNTNAAKDQDHIPMVILSDSQIPDRTAALLGTKAMREKVFKKLLKDAKTLKKADCTCMVMTCNTAHYFADKLEKKSGLKLYNMVRLASKKAAELCKKAKNDKVMLLATDGTIKTKVYQAELEKLGLKVVIPSAAVQKKVMHVIYDIVKAGKELKDSDWKLIDDAFKKSGAACGVLGCTELSIVKEKLGLSDKYIDAMDVLAKYCIEKLK